MSKQNYVLPVPLNVPRNAIERYAEDISAQFNLVTLGTDDDPLVEFIAKLGGEIHYEPEDDIDHHEDGSIVVHGPQRFDIYLSNYTGPLRDRFTLAHELGHYFLHSMQGKQRLRASRRGRSQSEWEANWFAAALLMPSEQFRTVWDSLVSKSVDALASRFKVSAQAALYRIDYLALKVE